MSENKATSADLTIANINKSLTKELKKQYNTTRKRCHYQKSRKFIFKKTTEKNKKFKAVRIQLFVAITYQSTKINPNLRLNSK